MMEGAPPSPVPPPHALPQEMKKGADGDPLPLALEAWEAEPACPGGLVGVVRPGEILGKVVCDGCGLCICPW